VDLRDLVETKDLRVIRHRVTKGLKVHQSKDQKVRLDLLHKETLDRLDLQETKDPPVQRVIRHKVQVDLLVTLQKDLPVDRDLQTLDQQDQQGTKVQLVQKVLKDRPHLKVLKVIKVLPHRRERLVQQGPRVTKDQEDPKEGLVIKDP
jgi:hypothetical protein